MTIKTIDNEQDKLFLLDLKSKIGIRRRLNVEIDDANQRCRTMLQGFDGAEIDGKIVCLIEPDEQFTRIDPALVRQNYPSSYHNCEVTTTRKGSIKFYDL